MSLKSANERQYPIFGYRVHTAVRSHFSFAISFAKKIVAERICLLLFLKDVWDGISGSMAWGGVGCRKAHL